MSITFGTTKFPGRFPVFWRGEAKVLPGDFKLKQAFAEDFLIPKGTSLQLDFANKEATVVKVAHVVAGGTTSAPRVAKGTLYQGGETVMKVGKTDVTVTISSVNRTNADYDVLTLSGAVSTLAAGDYIVEASAVSGTAAEGTKGVYILTIGTKPAAGDKLSLDGKEYEFAAAEGDSVFAVGADAKATAANIEDAVSAQYDGIFSVVAKNGKLTFTQLVGGVGAIPVLVVTPVAETGTLAATIAQTTAGVAASGIIEAAPLYAPDSVTSEDYTYKADGFQTVPVAFEALVLKEVAYPLPDMWKTGYSLKNNPSIKYIKQ